jgi:hypothetical protein
VTSPGRSPPRSKKESSDASEPAAASVRTEQREARDRARRERAESRAAAKEAKVADRAKKRDHIVEPPREPKPSLGQRLRGAGRSGAAGPGTRRRPGGKRVLSVLAGLVGAIGLLCSVVLALGALLAALDRDSGQLYDTVSGICDVLIGPLRDVISFSGSNARTKETLVAWGAGSVAYLVVGLVAQSLLRPASDD